MWSVDEPEYDDAYGTCEETEASFRMFHEMLNPSEISRLLNLEPSDSYRKGDIVGRIGRPRPFGAWLLSTEEVVQSRDLRRHLDWLVDHLIDRVDELHHLREHGYRMDVYCKWVSGGQGGPTLSPRNMEGLSALGLKLGIEVYWGGDEEARPISRSSAEDYG
jgi:hypothetical protein